MGIVIRERRAERIRASPPPAKERTQGCDYKYIDRHQPNVGSVHPPSPSFEQVFQQYGNEAQETGNEVMRSGEGADLGKP